MAKAALFQLPLRPEILHLGDYLTGYNAITTHRLDHKRYHPIHDCLSDFTPSIHSSLHLAAVRANEPDNGPPINDNFPRLADRELWDADCPACEKGLSSWIEVAERRAAAVLATRVPSLHSISFASFLSDKRICPSIWEVRLHGEDESGKVLSPEDTRDLLNDDLIGSRLWVVTFRASEPRAVHWEVFVRREVGWFPLS